MSSRLRMNRITSLFSFFTGATNTEHKNFEPEVRKGRHMIIYKETTLTILVTRLGVDMLYCDYLACMGFVCATYFQIYRK